VPHSRLHLPHARELSAHPALVAIVQTRYHPLSLNFSLKFPLTNFAACKRPCFQHIDQDCFLEKEIRKSAAEDLGNILLHTANK
jgi:hypothetical protein